MGSFSFDNCVFSSMTLIEERDDEQEQEEGMRENGDVGIDPPMYLGIGLGIDGGFVPPSFDDVAGAEEYYRRMVHEKPCNALFLGNYARLLESKGDLEEAEEYYFRASFVDPNNGEILMLYAKVVWKLHRDRERAQDYFERAVLVCPQHSDVLAAYARFMWEIEEENDPNKVEEKTYVSKEGFEGTDTEEFFKRMVDENPNSSIALRNYTHFLYKTKRDVKAAEDMYVRAILADPEDSNVLAAYARFIWEAGEEEDDNA